LLYTNNAAKLSLFSQQNFFFLSIFFRTLSLLFLSFFPLPNKIQDMGVSHSRIRTHKKRQQQLQIIDFGSIIPLGLYNKNDEYDLNLVRELIVSKKISPFYKGKSSSFCDKTHY
jgi:hypothetical protein